MKVHLNGRIVESEQATVGISDRGLLYGDGLYETIRVRNGKCVRFESHVRRLMHGAGVLEMPASVGAFDYAAAIAELLDANALSDARVRITITRGATTGDIVPSPDAKPTIFITAVPLPTHDPRPVSVIVSSFGRGPAPLCSVKTTNCLPSILAKSQAARRGADDALLTNTQGNIAEATTANVFIVKDNRLITPGDDQCCLPGTVRAAVLEMAPSLGLEPVESAVTPDLLDDADEMFLTSAIKLVRSVAGHRSTAVSERMLAALLESETLL